MKIGMKLTLGFAVTIILLIVIAVMGITNLSSLNTEVDELVHDKFIKTVWANGVIDEINAMARALRNAIITDDPEFSKKELQRITDGQAVIASNLDSLERTIVSEEGKKILEEIQTARKVFIDERNVIIDLVKANGVNGVDNNKQIQELLFKSFRKTQSNYMGSVTKLIEFQTELFNKAGQDAEATYNSAFMIILILAIVAIILAVGIALWVTKQITKPINQAVTASDSIAKGNLKVNLESNSKDETGLLLAAMRTMSANLNDMVKELNEVSGAAAEGKLDKRANEGKFEGEYKNIMSGFNKTLDAVIGPLNVTAEYVDRISKGDIPPKITDEYKGDFNEIKNNLNQCIDAVNALVSDATMLAKAAKEGKLDTRANANRHFGDFREIVSGVNDTLDNVIGPLNVAAEYVDRISKGDIPPKITDNYNGDFNEIKNNLNGAIDAISALVKDAKMLAKAAIEGKLDTRADASKHGGDFKAIVDGVNATLDNVIGPLNVAAEYVDRISKGDIPPKITDNYNGDFNEIKNNLNGAIDAVNALVADALMLANAAKEGKLDTRANAEKHYGDFREIVLGVNNTLDSVIGPLNVAAEYVDRISKGDIPPKITDKYNGDFNEIKNNLNGCIDSLNGLINDMNHMSKQHDLGDIDVQMDGSKYSGAYKDMAEGVNNMVFGHIAVKKKAMACFMEFGNGNLNAEIEQFPGKKKFINDTIEKVRENIKALVTDAVMLAQAAVDGKLDTRADATRHRGDFRKIVEGVNKTLDNVIGPLNVAAEYVDRISKGDIPPKITDNYNGDFNEIKNNLNQAIDAIDALVRDAGMLAKAAAAGQLSTRANADKHFGDFREIVLGVNTTIDNVVAPINEAAEILSQMATGDLTVRMFGDYNGDLAKLKNDINALGDSLSQLINQVNESVQNTASAALEISSTAEGLAASSQEQSAQADEVASAVEEMSRTVTENAMSATRTAEVAQQNGEVASEGARIVKQTVTKMRDIAEVVKHSAQNIQKLGESSKQIGEIISVIDDIADQTNLLALNAAIEAARAGEQGRGFAVVADEVRKLAERTTEATKQIANMIKGIQSETEMAVIAMNQGTIEVQSGIDYADRAGESLNAILTSTQELLDMINQIAAASEEQSATSEQISKNVMSISKVTAESAQRIEDVAHTSEDLAKLTEHLRNLMANFQVDDAGAGFSSRGLSGKPKRQLHGR